MRGGLAIILTVFIAVAIVAAYFFLGRAQITGKIQEVDQEILALEKQLQEIDSKRELLPAMLAELPKWQHELSVYKHAIPTAVQDDDFLGALAVQLVEQDVQLLSVELIPSGKWLGEIGEAQEEELEAAGIDVAAARQVLVAYYSISLIGEFDRVVTAFENLKRSRRLYTIDQVTGPAGRGAGSVSRQVDPNRTPIQITGRIYFGIPDSYLSDAELVHVFATAVISPQAREVGEEINARARQLQADTYGGGPAEDEHAEQPDSAAAPAAGSDDTGTPTGDGNSSSARGAAAQPTTASARQRSVAEVTKS